MGLTTGIGWTDATWNPWQGCRKISAGCKHCYMFREKRRYGQDPETVVRSKDPTFNLPLRLVKKLPAGAKVFTCSWSDFFIEEGDRWRPEAWEIIRQTPTLRYQVLTKRADRIRGHLPWVGAQDVWPHVWIGVSIENNLSAYTRLAHLLQVTAAVRWISYEPMLDYVDLDTLMQQLLGRRYRRDWGTLIQWIVLGGESGGAEARPFNVSDARRVIAQAHAAGARVYVKQLGANVRTMVGGEPRRVILQDAVHGKDVGEWPVDLRVQEFPLAA